MREFKPDRINCPLCRALKWSFFGIGLNRLTEEEVINHLLNCPSCRKEYEEYAKKCHWGEFNVEDIALKFKQDSMADTDKKEVTKDAWMTKYNNGEIIRLAASKAIRQIMKSVKDSEFAKFLTKKICQRLDHLEACYNKELEDVNAKSK